MKTNYWILKTELQQNKKHFLILFIVSLFLGIFAHVARKAETEIKKMYITEKWNADVLVLPKGVTITDFISDLNKGMARAFLPEAMFDSTVSLSEGKFKLTALMPVGGINNPRVLYKGEKSLIHESLLSKEVQISVWQNQNEFSTPEWGYKLISGFLASGSDDVMNKLKDLVDKRTVGQAFILKDQNKIDQERQARLQFNLILFSTILVLLFFFTLVSTFSWLNERIKNSFKVFEEMGVSSRVERQILASLIILVIFIPGLLGWLATYLIHL